MAQKKPISTYTPLEWTKVRVLAAIPVYDEYVPEVGKVYDAIRGQRQRFKGKKMPGEFCIVKIKDKSIVLRRMHRMEPEYEEVLE